jgi:AraC-like DNA-binding protein
MYLCFRKNNSLPNYILALVFLIPGLYFIDNLLILSNYKSIVQYSFFIVQILAILFPISVYYYVHLIIGDKKNYHKVLLTGSAILLLYILYLSFNFFTLSSPEKELYISSLNGENYPISMMLYTVLFYIWQVVYFIVLVIEIKKYNRKAESSFSNFDSIRIHYVKKFMLLLGVLNIGLIIFYIALPLPLVDYGILPLFVTIIYLFIMYFAITQKAIFSKVNYIELNEENSSINALELEEEENETSTPIDEKTKLLGQKIEFVLIQQKAHHNPNLKLGFLADQVQEPAYLVSQALNKYFGKSFYELVNELRIKEAEMKLKEFNIKKETIEGLALDVGFNSRAAFYRAFKKHTGKTPTEFLQS